MKQRDQTRERRGNDKKANGAGPAHGAGSVAEYNSTLVVTKPLAGVSGDEPSDIRRARVLPVSIQLRALARRLTSIVALVTIDVGGLAAALYLALILRELYYCARPILWGLAWQAEGKWLPFLTTVTVLVFWRARLYATREQRAGLGRIVSSLLLVTVITLAFAVGSNYPTTTFGLYATGFVLAVIVIGSLRGAYQIVARGVWRPPGGRRR